MRIISYNIHSGKDLFWRKRLTEMAATLAELEADVICLQEVQQNTRFGYQVDFMEQTLSMQAVFSPSIIFANGGYGNALFTRLPILETTAKKLPAKREPRSLLQVKLDIYGTVCTIFCTHLSLDKKSRELQMKFLTHEANSIDEPLLLLGDLNTTSPILPTYLSDAASGLLQPNTPTVIIPSVRVDYLFVSKHWQVLNYQVVDVRWSDHYPIQATLALPGSSIPVQ